MKIVYTSLLLTSMLLARENPFQPTQTYIESKNILLQEVKNNENTYSNEDNLLVSDETQYNEIQEDTIETKQNTQFLVKDGCKENYEFRLVDFIHISIDIDQITIQIDKKYPLINQDIHKDIQKFVFDFKSNTSFYTKREPICNNYFENISVGSHDKKGFFRIALKTSLDINNYVESIDTANNTIKINIIDINN